MTTAEKMLSLPCHYEKHLGLIAKGWSDKESEYGVYVVSFNDIPDNGVITFATLGLSSYSFPTGQGAGIKQELLISVEQSFDSDRVASFLMFLAEHIVIRNKAVLRGEVIDPARPIIAGASSTAVYATNPSPFGDEFMNFRCDPSLVFVYLIAISGAEAELIRRRGWRWFEDRLESEDPNIWNLCRTEEIRDLS
jgi:antitoxin YqcF